MRTRARCRARPGHRPPGRRSPRPEGAASRRRPQERSRDREAERAAERTRPRSASTILEAARRSTTARRRRARSCPPTNELIWGILSFAVVLFLLWKFGWPGHQEGHGGPHRADPRRPRAGRSRARPRPSGPGEYQAQLADASNESARIIEEARQTADAMRRDRSAGRGRASPRCARRPPPTSRRPRRRPWPTSGARSPRSPSVPPSEVVEHNLDRETNRALVESLHRPGRTRRRTDGRARTDVSAYAEALFADRQRRGRRSARSRTSCSASPGSSRATTSCATTLSRPAHPGRPAASRSSRTCSAARPSRPPSTSCRWWSATAGSASCRPSSTAHDRAQAAAEADKEVAEVRSAIPLTDDQKRPPGRGPRQGDRQAGRGQGHRRPVGQGRPRRPGGRHRHRRLGPPPPRTAPQRSSSAN